MAVSVSACALISFQWLFPLKRIWVLTRVKLNLHVNYQKGEAERMVRKKVESLKKAHFAEVKESWFLEIKT